MEPSSEPVASLDLPMPLPPVKIRPANAIPAYMEQEYVVSPSTPLLSTEVTENGWVCGDNNKGQLGINGTTGLSEPQQIQTVGKLAAISLGHEHSAGVAGDGALYTWGTNSKGQLGNCEQGDVRSIPTKVEELHSDVRSVACGLEHTVCLTSKDVLAWGSNSYGQLGHGENTMEIVLRPQAIRSLHDFYVTQVCCGNYHTICVTAQSQVYAWGNNSAGQLGLGDKRDRATPTPVEALWALPVTQLAAGEFHSVALTSNGHMFSWGSNHFGQLGLPPDAEHAAQASHKSDSRRGSRKRKTNQKFLLMLMEMGIPKNKAELALEETGNVGVEVATEWLFSAPENVIEQCLAEDGYSSTESPHSEDNTVLTPRRVPLKSVRYINGGSNHTVAVTQENVYSWGEGKYGALGHGGLEDKPIPTRITTLDGKKIDKVACGRHHTLFLAQDGTVWGCGSSKYGQLAPSLNRLKEDKIQTLPIKLSLPFATPSGKSSKKASAKSPVVQEVVAGGNCSAFLTRGPDEIPQTHSVDLLARLQGCIQKATNKTSGSGSSTADKTQAIMNQRAVATGIEMIFGSAAAISAAFGHRDGVGLNVELLDQIQSGLLKQFSDEQAIVQAMFKSATQLLEDLNTHVRLLSMPERAQVLLAAAQHPLLAEHSYAKLLLPRLCSTILSAPSAARHLLVKWWSDYPGALLEERVVKPLQSYLTKELMATKKLTISVMNAIKVLARVEEANQVARKLPPEAFYNQLISEKMDVQDHYTAWRQTQDQPVRRQGFDGPFSFCSYPFLLDARAKSNLLYIEARVQMEQTVAHARMEQQLYGSSSNRRTEEETRVIAKKQQLRHDEASSSRGGKKKGSDRDSRRNKQSERGGIRNIFNIILHRRPESGSSSSDRDSPKALEGLRRDGSMNLPKPTECNMPGTHSDMCILRVRRNHLVEDALDEISRQYKRDLFKPLRVHFIGEEGIDAGGVKKEFFQLLVAELLSPDYGMLVFQPESNTYWFNQCSLEGDEQFQLLGLVLGLAIYNRVLLDFALPIPLYKKLLGQSVTLRDLEEMQPTLGRSLRQLLQYDGPGSVEEVFYQTFSVEVDYFGELRVQELRPGGESIFVTEENRHEYVELVVDFWLNKSIQRHFEAFTKGFHILCDGPAIHLFNAQELERLVCGNPNLDFEALQKNAKYEGGFTTSTPAVMWLWEIVREFELEEKKKILKFFTGSDRSPIGGLGALKCVIQRDGPDSNKLPTSHTCFNTLLLPEYSSKKKMHDLLKLAIMNSEGFGLE